MKITFTERQRDALLDVLRYIHAGGEKNLLWAFNLKGREAADMFRILERVRSKLTSMKGEE